MLTAVSPTVLSFILSCEERVHRLITSRTDQTLTVTLSNHLLDLFYLIVSVALDLQQSCIFAYVQTVKTGNAFMGLSV